MKNTPNRFGDIRLIPTPDGARFSFADGQPEMDGTLENSVYLSLFCPNWWGNAVSRTDQRMSSTLQATVNRSKISNQGRLDVIASAQSSLAWMVQTGIASKVDVSAVIVGVGKMELTVAIEQPTAPREILRYQINWEQQQIASTSGRIVREVV
jgi:phage gp46-like protein